MKKAIFLLLALLLAIPIFAQSFSADVQSFLLGSLSIGAYFGALLMAGVGALLHLWLDVQDRDKESTHTPFVWSWRFFAFDNIKRGIATILLILVVPLIFEHLFNIPLTASSALLWGFSLDRVAVFGKKHYAILQANRDKLFAQ